MRSIFCLLLVIGTSCSGQKKVSVAKGDIEVFDTIKLQLVLHDSYSNVQNETFQIITENSTLKKVFLQINKTRKPGIPIPEIDFNEQSLLFYGAGIATGATNMELFVIEESLDSIKIGVKNIATLKKGDLSATTTPFYLYSIPRTKKGIMFIGKKEASD